MLGLGEGRVFSILFGGLVLRWSEGSFSTETAIGRDPDNYLSVWRSGNEEQARSSASDRRHDACVLYLKECRLSPLELAHNGSVFKDLDCFGSVGGLTTRIRIALGSTASVSGLWRLPKNGKRERSTLWEAISLPDAGVECTFALSWAHKRSRSRKSLYLAELASEIHWMCDGAIVSTEVLPLPKGYFSAVVLVNAKGLDTDIGGFSLRDNERKRARVLAACGVVSTFLAAIPFDTSAPQAQQLAEYLGESLKIPFLDHRLGPNELDMFVQLGKLFRMVVRSGAPEKPTAGQVFAAHLTEFKSKWLEASPPPTA